MEKEKRSLDTENVCKTNKKEKVMNALIVLAIIVVAVSLIALFRSSLTIGGLNL